MTTPPSEPENRSRRGIVYILQNDAMVGYIKIGRTTGTSAHDVLQRMAELDQTGVPREFRCPYAALVDNHQSVERSLHEIFEDRRVRPRREFFEGVPLSSVVAALRLVEIEDVTPPAQDQEASANEKPPLRPPFRFSLASIPVGGTPPEKLYWWKDSNIVCEVASDRTIHFRDKEMSLTAAATQLLGYEAASGPEYWMYDGETLSARRRRIENQVDDAGQ